MKKIKAFVFDADGVLIKSDFFFSQRFSEKYKIPYEKIMPFFEKEFRDCVVWKSDLKTVILPYLKDWNWTWTLDEILQFWFENENKIEQKIIDIIKRLRNKWYKCYLATNQEKYRAEYMQNVMKIFDIFDDVFISCNIWYKKPHLEFYQTVYESILKNLDIRKDEILYIDDTKDNIDKAEYFGWKVYRYFEIYEFEKFVNNKII